MTKRKINIYIDGFNLYFALKNHSGKAHLWLNLKALAKKYMSPDQELETIYYFSAFSAADAYDKIKHQRYIEALKTEGIKIIMGEYQKVTRKFSKKMPIIYVEHISDPLIPYTIKQKCIPEKIHYKNFEEKRTDVNIATRIVADAFLSTCDDMMIITGDSDIAPAIYMVKRYCKEIRITSVLPIKSKGQHIQSFADVKKTMGSIDIAHSLFPPLIKTKRGSIVRPANRL